MPTHMRSRFNPGQLASWQPADPLPFTKGVRTMRMAATGTLINPWHHGTLLFDLATDPRQERPLLDDELELRMLRLLVKLMHASDAPRSQFQRLGVPDDGEVGPEHLLVRVQAERAAATAEPLGPFQELPTDAVVTRPILQLLADSHARRVLDQQTPGLTETELVSMPAHLSLLDLTRRGVIDVKTLRSLATSLQQNAGT